MSILLQKQLFFIEYLLLIPCRAVICSMQIIKFNSTHITDMILIGNDAFDIAMLFVLRLNKLLLHFEFVIVCSYSFSFGNFWLDFLFLEILNILLLNLFWLLLIIIWRHHGPLLIILWRWQLTIEILIYIHRWCEILQAWINQCLLLINIFKSG